MDPNEVDFALECAPERDEAHEAYIAYLNENESGMIGSMLHEESPELAAAAAGLPVEPGYDEDLMDARLEDALYERAARKMPQPAPAYTPRYASIGPGMFVRIGRRRA